MGKKRNYGGSEDSPDACFGGPSGARFVLARHPNAGYAKASSVKYGRPLANDGHACTNYSNACGPSRALTVGGSPAGDGSLGGWCPPWPALEGQTAGGSWAGCKIVILPRFVALSVSLT